MNVISMSVKITEIRKAVPREIDYQEIESLYTYATERSEFENDCFQSTDTCEGNRNTT